MTITAPFSGKLIDVGTFEAGTDASAGAKVCTLVNDKVLKLSLYYSYAYENSIYVGQRSGLHSRHHGIPDRYGGTDQ